jgi:DNA-binding CsgD family transcriptional regulator
MVGGPAGTAWPAGVFSDGVGCAAVDFGPSVVDQLGVVSENSRPLFLSPRQTDVLTLAAAGCTERETALRLGIATATVRGHLARARERLGARSTCQAVALAVRAGLLEVADGSTAVLGQR